MRPTVTDSVVVARDLVVGEGATRVPLLRCREVSVARGTMVGLHGPSGSGKSTLLRVLTMRQPALAGEIAIQGRPIAALPARITESLRAATFAVVSQTNGLVTALTAQENIHIGCAIAGPDPDLAALRATATRLGVVEVLHHHPAQLSGGQCQRVQLARAGLSAAPMMVLDEPTSGLDEGWRDQALRFIAAQVHEHGRAALLVSHDPAALAECDVVYSVHDGLVERDH